MRGIQCLIARCCKLMHSMQRLPTPWDHRKDMTEKERQQLAELAAELLLPLVVKDHLLGIGPGSETIGHTRAATCGCSSPLRRRRGWRLRDCELDGNRVPRSG